MAIFFNNLLPTVKPFDYYNLLAVRILAVLLIILASIGCKSTETTQSEDATRDRAELEELYWARVDSSRMSFTKADVKFMTGMIAHHAQALVMSRLAPFSGAKRDITSACA